MFQVEWLQSALDELAEGWNRSDSSERKAMTVACHEVDQWLRADPLGEGEARMHAQQRIAFLPPLAVSYHVDRDNRMVTIFHVRLFRRRT